MFCEGTHEHKGNDADIICFVENGDYAGGSMFWHPANRYENGAVKTGSTYTAINGKTIADKHRVFCANLLYKKHGKEKPTV